MLKATIVKINDLFWVTQIEYPPALIDPVTKEKVEQPPIEISRRLALITDGQYESNGRISNFWSWTYFDETNQFLTNDKAGGYPNGYPYKFEAATGFKLRITAYREDPN